MHLVCIAKPGLALHQLVSESETSRHILRFYRPQDCGWGIITEVATVSSALALVSELRWYIMRYTAAVLIEDTEHGVYLTRALAAAAYETREVQLEKGWKYAYILAVTETGRIEYFLRDEDIPPQARAQFIVWGTAAEMSVPDCMTTYLN